MSAWELAAAGFVALLVPCGWLCVLRSFTDGVVAVQLAGAIASLALLTLAAGTGREPFATLALVLAVLSFAGTLICLRFLERSRERAGPSGKPT